MVRRGAVHRAHEVNPVSPLRVQTAGIFRLPPMRWSSSLRGYITPNLLPGCPTILCSPLVYVVGGY